jgi:hypothetical protein
MARYPSILIPACAYAMVFLFGSVLSTVEVPQLLQEKFELNAEQLGLQFLGVIIGSVLGEQMGGVLSDFWMSRRSRRIGRKAEPEFRLWLSYFGFALTIIGTIVFLVCTQASPSGHWSVSPIIGTGIGAVGNQLVTTVMITYAVDCFPQEAGNIGVFVTFVRQIWGFLGPFWYVFLSSTGLGIATVVANMRLGSLLCLRALVLLPARELCRQWSWLPVLFPPSFCTGTVSCGVARSEGSGIGLDFGFSSSHSKAMRLSSGFRVSMYDKISGFVSQLDLDSASALVDMGIGAGAKVHKALTNLYSVQIDSNGNRHRTKRYPLFQPYRISSLWHG